VTRGDRLDPRWWGSCGQPPKVTLATITTSRVARSRHTPGTGAFRCIETVHWPLTRGKAQAFRCIETVHWPLTRGKRPKRFSTGTIDCPEGLHDFSQFLQANAGGLPPIRARSLSSKSYTVRQTFCYLTPYCRQRPKVNTTGRHKSITFNCRVWVRIRPEAHQQFHGAVFLGQLTLSKVHRSPPLYSKNLFWASPDFHALLQRFIFRHFRKVFEKRLLVSSCLSVCTSAWNNSPALGRSFVNFICKNCIKIWHENSVLLKIERIYRAHYVKT
jgi:hypothetical protein